MSRELLKSAIKTNLSRILELDITPEINDLARPSKADIVIATTDGFDIRVSRAFAVNLLLIASGETPDHKLDESTAEKNSLCCNRISGDR
jgi:hypothetical protein